MLKDMTDVRYVIRQTWAENRESRVTLTTAAVTTNAAISIFRRLNEAFIANFPEFDDHGKIIDFIYERYCDPHNGAGSAGFATYKTTQFNLPSKVFFCDNTCELTKGFIGRSVLPFYQPGTKDRLRLTDAEETTLQCLSLLRMLSANYHEVLPQDQLIQAIAHIRETRKYSTWVAFAIQLSIDIRLVLGTKGMDRSLQEVRILQNWICKTATRCQEFGHTNKVNLWYKINFGGLEVLRKSTKIFLEEDFMQKILDEEFADEPEKARRYNYGPFFLMRNDPMLPGLLLQDMLTKLHQIGVSLTADQGVVMTAIHLYNSAHKSDRVSRTQGWFLSPNEALLFFNYELSLISTQDGSIWRM